jgi:hypothetical protein
MEIITMSLILLIFFVTCRGYQEYSDFTEDITLLINETKKVRIGNDLDIIEMHSISNISFSVNYYTESIIIGICSGVSCTYHGFISSLQIKNPSDRENLIKITGQKITSMPIVIMGCILFISTVVVFFYILRLVCLKCISLCKNEQDISNVNMEYVTLMPPDHLLENDTQIPMQKIK